MHDLEICQGAESGRICSKRVEVHNLSGKVPGRIAIAAVDLPQVTFLRKEKLVLSGEVLDCHLVRE